MLDVLIRDARIFDFENRRPTLEVQWRSGWAEAADINLDAVRTAP